MIDLCHLDGAGFAMTQPTSYSWFPKGKRLTIPFEANQGRRVNVIGAYFSHGPCAGRFEWEAKVSLPKSRAKKPRKSPSEQAEAHGVKPEEVGKIGKIGKIDSDCLLSFLWRIAGRPEEVPEGWERERPLVSSLDNYSVHKSEAVEAAKSALKKADIHLFYLPSYSPELSEIEPIWHDVKSHELAEQSQDQLGDLLKSVADALQRKAAKLQTIRLSDHSLCITT